MIVDQRANRFSFAFPSDERRQLNWQVLPKIPKRFERREFFLKLWMRQLKDVFGLSEISQPMLTQVDERCICRERFAYTASGDACDKNLSTMADGSETRRTVHVGPTIIH